jgi:EAL domain-containing protein (putative c-di-GMP-specific phosphodiesterase class I)
MDSPDLCEPNIRALRAAGIRIALDDFGTGYSSLSHLRQFEVDRVKIDRSFVNSIDRAEDSSAIIQAIVDLAQATGLSVTAEGVETQEQSNFLSGIGCNELQGFLLSRPMPVGQMDDLMGVQPRAKAEDGQPIAA